MDGKKAADLCIRNLRSVENILDRIDRKELRVAMQSLDAANSQLIVRDAIFND